MSEDRVGSVERNAVQAGNSPTSAHLVRVWEYDVDPGRVEDFRAAYGPAGAWAALFARSAGYLGTELYESTSTPGRFLTVDRFSSEEQWLTFLSEHRGDYARLDEQCSALTRSERELAPPP